MDWLYSLLENSSIPVITALILGILTAVSPCPLATNLTAVAYLGRELENRRKVFYLGLLYTLGRTIAYSVLGAVLIFLIRKGEDAFGIQDAISTIGEWILGPALVLIGLFYCSVICSVCRNSAFLVRRQTFGHKEYWVPLSLVCSLPWLSAPQAVCSISACSSLCRQWSQAVTCSPWSTPSLLLFLCSW